MDVREALYTTRMMRRLLEVPTGEGWRMIAMLALGYPLGRWGWPRTGARCTRSAAGTAGGSGSGAPLLRPSGQARRRAESFRGPVSPA